MSIAELKNKLIDEINIMDDEKALKEILEHLQHLHSGEKILNLSKHFAAADKQFGEALHKLAQ